jgi:hypothetical protein
MTNHWSKGFASFSRLLDPSAEIPQDAPPDPREIIPVRDRRLEIPPNVKKREPLYLGRRSSKHRKENRT